MCFYFGVPSDYNHIFNVRYCFSGAFEWFIYTDLYSSGEETSWFYDIIVLTDQTNRVKMFKGFSVKTVIQV